MGVWSRYKLRLRRKRLRFRAFRKRRNLTAVANRTSDIRKDSILLVAVLRNERVRLPYFLRYYRDLGINQFLIVDNGSDDGSREFLVEQHDVSLWTTGASYKDSRYGIDWVNWLLMRYAHKSWVLVVDVDEFFVYPFCDTRPIRALTDWLDTYGLRSFPAMVLDMYPKGSIAAERYREGRNPFEIANYFDSGNYSITKNPSYGNLWIQGGPRARTMFADAPYEAPSLNKIPLVKWHRSYCFVSSTHMLLPRGLNAVFDEWGGEKTSGCLLHAKFLSTLQAKVDEEMVRRQHFAESREYQAYSDTLKENPDLWCKWSEKYINWRQLEILGLMSKGNWA
ncbi:MAG: glycosyltransferase family 2 protein [Rhodobacteraceae bacterium]|nr:glycosyltransferase family 2 protein [Paracoccaceae bacterium]